MMPIGHDLKGELALYSLIAETQSGCNLGRNSMAVVLISGGSSRSAKQ